MTIKVFGTGYEGTIDLLVFPGGASGPGEEVATTFVTTEQNVLGEASTSLDLPAGDYTLRVWEDYGEDGDYRELDSKAFSVR